MAIPISRNSLTYSSVNSIDLTSKQEQSNVSKDKKAENTSEFKSTSDYLNYLKKNYEGLNNDNSRLQVTISPAYLKKCISDPQKRVDLEKTLKFNLSSMKEWDQMLALKGQELRFMKKEIDEDGNVNTTTVTGPINTDEEDNEDKKNKKNDKKSNDIASELLSSLDSKSYLQQKKADINNSNTIVLHRKQLLADQFENFQMKIESKTKESFICNSKV